jgi:Tfp pilus assembly protein PilF
MQTVCLWALMGGVALGLTGCGTTPKSATHPRKQNTEQSRAETRDNSDLFPEADAERRIEAQARFGAGLLSELDQDANGALEHYYRSALADPSHEALVLDVARRLLQQKDADRAIQLLTRATAVPNASGLAYAYLGVAYAQTGKNDLAIAAHRAAIKRMPRSPAAYQNLIQLYAQHAQTKEALQVLDEAEKQPDLDAQSLIDLAEVLTGFSQMKKLDLAIVKPKVIELLDRAAALKPEDPAVLEKLADGFRLLGESARAEEFFEKLVQGQPNAFRARAKLAELYLRNNDPKRAAQQWEAILRETPTDPAAYYVLGNIAQGQKNFAKAEECFEKVLLLGQANEQVYFELALIQINLNKP